MMNNDNGSMPPPVPDYPGSNRDYPGTNGNHAGPPASSIGPPPSHHTTVTMTTTPGSGGRPTEINLNFGYFRTFPGIIKIIQLILGILCMALSSPARQYVNENFGVGHNHWFLFVVVTSFIISLLWSFFYLLQIKDSINMQLPFSWLKLELVYTAVAALLYAIAFIVLLAGFGWCAGDRRKCDTRTAAGVFGLFNTIVYAVGAYILHNDYKATPPELQ